MTGDRVRAFAAVVPPAHVQQAVADCVADLGRRLPGLRLVRASNLHLTLRFFGDLDPGQVETVIRVLDAVASRSAPFDLELAGLGVFPGPHRPRVLWMGAAVGGPILEALARELDRSLDAAGLGRADKDFVAHLTLGRWRDGSGLPAARVREILESSGEPERFPVDGIDLMKSTLGRGGAVYDVMHRSRFGRERE